jgi:hypothetical protein
MRSEGNCKLELRVQNVEAASSRFAAKKAARCRFYFIVQTLRP